MNMETQNDGKKDSAKPAKIIPMAKRYYIKRSKRYRESLKKFLSTLYLIDGVQEIETKLPKINKRAENDKPKTEKEFKTKNSKIGMKYKKFRPYKPEMIKLKKIRLPFEEMNGSSFVAHAFS